MAKIDLEKVLIALLDSPFNKQFDDKVKDALKEQGLEYKDGEIVESQRPKFKVGDWIIDKQGIVHQIANVVENVTNHTYGYDIVGGGYFNDNTEGIRLWTIQDAKDGDVLACGDEVSDCPFIFHNLNKKLNPRSYCGVNTICDFQENDENGGSWCDSEEVRPATKEQRDFLFSKMHEAGYEWDNEMKELEKVEPADEIGRKFKVGDIVQYITDSTDRRKIVGVDTLCDMYTTDSSPIMFEVEDEWKVVVNAEDIEQNPAPEPKFKAGDWVINKFHDICLITDIDLENGYYICESNRFGDTDGDIDLTDKAFHLWTIQDANDGDVLVASDESLFIFARVKDNAAYYHFSLCKNGSQEISDGKHSWEVAKACHPATKKQRDLLFQKMKEAGYEWDAEKKELKKIDNRFDYEHANIQQKDFAPKAITANRQLYNRAILKILSNYVEKYPDIRFGQMLCNLDIKPHFDEESQKTYLMLNETINKQE